MTPESTLDTPEVMDHLARDGRVVFDRIHITKSGDKIPYESQLHLTVAPSVGVFRRQAQASLPSARAAVSVGSRSRQ